MFIDTNLLALARLAGWRVLATIAAGVGAAGASVCAAFALSAVVGGFLDLAAGHTDGAPTSALLLAAAAVAARGALLWVRDVCAVATANHVKATLRARLLGHAFDLGPAHRWPRGQGGVQASLVDGVEHLQAWVGFYLPQLVTTLVVPAALVLVLAARDLAVALVVAAGIALIPVAQRLWARILGERSEEHWDAYEAYAARIGDTLRGITTLVALGAAARQGAKLREDAEKLRRATNANLRASLGVSAVTAGAMSVGTSGATLLAAWHATTGSLAPGDVVLVLFLAAECFRPLQELQTYWHEGFYGQAASRGLRALEAERPLVTDRAATPGATLPQAAAIDLDGVSYAYPNAKEPAVRSVSLHVPAGAVLAVVGPSGSGKTTLARLLLRDMDPDAGEIRIGGRDARSYPLRELRRGTALVAQQVVLLDGSIRDNIRAADPGAAEERVVAAAAAARVDEFAAALPGGLDAAVGERGSALSGGQRQRVALARALLADTPLLVLDEATSALDAENEGLITEALARLRGRTTSVVIAHRLSTVMDADLVVVLEDGEVAQFGPPGELALVDGPWARMLAAQRRDLQEVGR
ncbi:MAG: ABC transporter ATP-binding protein [Arachnia sp.]